MWRQQFTSSSSKTNLNGRGKELVCDFTSDQTLPQSVAAQSDHFCDLIDDDGRLVLVIADIDVLGTSKPGLIVKQDFAGRTWVEHGVDVREVHDARDRIYHYCLSGGVRRSRSVAGEG